MDSSKFLSLAFQQVCLAEQALDQFNIMETPPKTLVEIGFARSSLEQSKRSLAKAYSMARTEELAQHN
jgi:hypothetical protein